MSENPKLPVTTLSQKKGQYFPQSKQRSHHNNVEQIDLASMLSPEQMEALRQQQFKNLLAGLEKTKNKMTTGSIQKNCTKKNNKGFCAIQGGKTRKHKKSQRKTRRVKKH